MSLVGLNIGTHDSLAAKTRRYADYYRQLAAGTIKEVVDDDTVELASCFYRSPVEKVTFTRCKKIKSYAFRLCGELFLVDFPELESMGTGSFLSATKLSSVFFPKVTSVASTAFQSSGVETVDLPSCTRIMSGGFAYCAKLREIKIPICKTLDSKSFLNCSALEKIFLDGVTTVPTLAADALTGTPDTMKIIVPDALVDSFKVAKNWSTYAGRIIGVTEYEATQAQ